jgi:histidyl-tRNA synthetase
MTKKDRAQPETLKGFRDYLPGDMIARQRVIDTIRGVYERFGFVPVDTPVLEHEATLLGTGGEETNKQLFRMESPEGEPIAMRFDLTVPFARLLAQYPEQLPVPFRRYHIGPVFRADKPGPGRYRQFTQCDIDAAGGSSVAVDAEIVAVMCEALRALGLFDESTSTPEYRVHVNSRRVMDAALSGFGITEPAVQKHVLRVIDKLSKVGIANVRLELGKGRIDESGDPIKGVGLPPEVIEKVVAFVGITGGTRAEVIDSLSTRLSPSELLTEALTELRVLASALNALGVSEKEVVFDPSLARGLDYYTGPVYETVLPGAPEFGSIMGGGRYDGLVSRFLDRPIPSTGASIGIDRLMAALTALGKVQAPKTTVAVMILQMRGVDTAELLAIARELRNKGIPTEVFLGSRKAKINQQLSLANERGIPVAVIVGSDELANGTVAVKDLVAGRQQREGIEEREEYLAAGKAGQVTIPRAELAEYVTGLLKQQRSS